MPVVRATGPRVLAFLVDGRPRGYDFSGETTFDLIVLYEPGREPRAIAPADIDRVAEYFGFDLEP